MALALAYFEKSPQPAMDLLTQTVSQCSHYLKALQLLNPCVVQQLWGVNLLTGKHDPPPPQHWRTALEAAQLTPAQFAKVGLRPQLQCSCCLLQGLQRLFLNQ